MTPLGDNISYLLLINLSPVLLLSLHQDLFKLGLIREGHKLCSNLLEEDNFQDLTFCLIWIWQICRVVGCGYWVGNRS